jgi:hypothetical protein
MHFESYDTKPPSLKVDRPGGLSYIYESEASPKTTYYPSKYR